MSKKILIVTHHFYPEINPRAFRANELVKEFVARGYWVNLIYGEGKFILDNESIPQYIRYCNNTQKLQPQQIFTKVKDKSFVKKIFHYFIAEKFMLTRLKWVLHAISNINEYDAVISIGTPFYVHLAVALAMRQQHTNIVAICDNGDPFYNYKKHDKAAYWGIIQKYVFSKFDYICTPTQNAVSYYEKYALRERIKVIPQGYNMCDVSTAEYRKNTVATFAFAGRFYEDIRNPEPLLKFLAALTIPFKFVVYAPLSGNVYEHILLPYKDVLQEKLVLCNMLSREQCIFELSKMDFLINIENTLSVQVPSKMVDYTLSKRPIISFTHTAIPCEKLEQWLQGNYVDPLKVDISPFDIKNVVCQFEQLLKEKSR